MSVGPSDLPMWITDLRSLEMPEGVRADPVRKSGVVQWETTSKTTTLPNGSANPLKFTGTRHPIIPRTPSTNLSSRGTTTIGGEPISKEDDSGIVYSTDELKKLLTKLQIQRVHLPLYRLTAPQPSRQNR